MQPTTDQIRAVCALYLRHEPHRHALMRGPQADRKYTEYHRPITDQQIVAHLRGQITLAAPMIGPDGLAQAAALDVDAGGVAALRRALDTAQADGWTAYAITSTNDDHDGGHLWVHLDTPTTPDRARLLAQNIAEAAQVQAETYPTRKQLRLPLGVHRWSNQRGMLLLQDGTTIDLDSGDEAIAQALSLIAALPRNRANRLPEIAIQPKPARSPHTHPTTRQKPVGSARDAIQAYNQATDLIGLLESYGGRIAQRVSGGGVLMHCPCGGHSHGDRRPSLEIKPARSARYGRYIAVGYSSSCQFYTERGQVFAPFDVLCRLEGLTNVEALKQINPCRPPKATRSRPAPESEPEPDWNEPTPEERAESAEQRRRHIAEAHATHAEIQARLETDRELSARARAIMIIMLQHAADSTWCRMSTAGIAKDYLQVSERTVQRGMRELERHGYITSDTHTTSDGRTYQGGKYTTVKRFLRVTQEAATCHPCIKLKEDLNLKSVKACEPPRDSAQPCSSSPEAEPIACEGGASYNPAEDWTLTTAAAPERKPWRASVPPKDFFTLYHAARDRRTAQAVPSIELPRHIDELPRQAEILLDQTDELPRPAPAQLGNIEAQIWRTPPTDPKQRRTYYVLKRKAEQVERTNPKQAHALRMQARSLEEVSELLIAATSCTTDELHHPNVDRRQVEVAPVTGCASSEPPAARSLLPGIQRRPRLVNVTPAQSSGTSSVAGAAPSVTGGGSHAQTSVKPGEVDVMWLAAKMRQIATLEQQGQHDRVEFLRRVLGL